MAGLSRRRVHILNLGHTYIADIWRREGRPETETVRNLLGDHGVKARLLSLYRDEVLPGFAARGMGEQAKLYLNRTVERSSVKCDR